jgi:hypothetical protein
MNVRNLKMSDTYQRGDKKYIIENGLRNIQLTEIELLNLQEQLNEFILHNVGNSVCRNFLGDG